jgi:glycerophosphoryl diester phosphodiesterase
MKRIAGLLALAIALTVGCKKEELEADHNILACGHGGSGFQSYSNPYPANSMSSIQRAIEGLGADGVEVDVQMSADKKLFLYHNNELESMTGCTGCIPGMNSADIMQCKYDRDFGVNQFSDEKIALLESVLERYSKYPQKKIIYLDLRINNECDPSKAPNLDTMASEIVKMIHRYDALNWVHVISNSTDMLSIARKYERGLRLYFEGNGEEALAAARQNKFHGIVSGNDSITKQHVDLARENGIRVVIFKVKTREGTLSAIRKGPDAIQADNLELLLEMLHE